MDNRCKRIVPIPLANQERIMIGKTTCIVFAALLIGTAAGAREKQERTTAATNSEGALGAYAQVRTRPQAARSYCVPQYDSSGVQRPPYCH
jgi:hypothetical protein